MMPNHFERELFARAYRQNLLREAEYERLLEQLSEPERRTLPTLVRLMLSVRALRIKLREGLQRPIA